MNNTQSLAQRLLRQNDLIHTTHSAQSPARGGHRGSLGHHQRPYSIPEIVRLTPSTSAGERMQGTVGFLKMSIQFEVLLDAQKSERSHDPSAEGRVSSRPAGPEQSVSINVKTETRHLREQPEAPCRPGAHAPEMIPPCGYSSAGTLRPGTRAEPAALQLLLPPTFLLHSSGPHSPRHPGPGHCHLLPEQKPLANEMSSQATMYLIQIDTVTVEFSRSQEVFKGINTVPKVKS